jgi:hypothetical protein
MRFMLLFRGLAAAPEAEDEQTAEYNARWASWMGGLAERGALLSGAPFGPGGSVVTGVEVSRLELERVDIGGFALIEAESEGAAVEIAKSAPHAVLGGTTVVRPLIAVG